MDCTVTRGVAEPLCPHYSTVRVIKRGLPGTGDKVDYSLRRECNELQQDIGACRGVKTLDDGGGVPQWGLDGVDIKRAVFCTLWDNRGGVINNVQLNKEG